MTARPSPQNAATLRICSIEETSFEDCRQYTWISFGVYVPLANTSVGRGRRLEDLLMTTCSKVIHHS
jgi:hypothetical protein